jgi:hypothetical protein
VWLKQSSQGVKSNAPSSSGAAPSSVPNSLFEAIDAVVAKSNVVLPEMKQLSFAEEVAKGRRAQALLGVALNLIKTQGSLELKTQLATELKLYKEGQSNSSDADVRKEILARYDLDGLERAIEKLSAVKKSLEQGDALKSPVVARRTVAEQEELRQSGGKESPPPKSPATTRRDPDEEIKSPRLVRQATKPLEEEIKLGKSAEDIKSPRLARQATEEMKKKVEEDPQPEMSGPDHSLIELDKFAQPYNPDAKFERAQPGVPQAISKSSGEQKKKALEEMSVDPISKGLLPKMGRKEEARKVPGTGSSCPVCQTRFPDQASLLAHIETCAASQVTSPLPPTKEAPAPTGSKARDLFRKISELATGPQQAAAAQPQQSANFISGPTDVTHEAHASPVGALSGALPVAKKRPPKTPAPMPPGVKKPAKELDPVPPSRSRSRSGGSSQNMVAPGRGNAGPRRRSVSIGSKIEIPGKDEEDEVIESHLEVIFYSGDVSLDALNFALGTRSAQDAEVKDFFFRTFSLFLTQKNSSSLRSKLGIVASDNWSLCLYQRFSR